MDQSNVSVFMHTYIYPLYRLAGQGNLNLSVLQATPLSLFILLLPASLYALLQIETLCLIVHRFITMNVEYRLQQIW